MSSEANRQQAAGNPARAKAETLREALRQAADFIGSPKTLDHIQRNLSRGNRCIHTIEVYRDNDTGVAHLRLLATSSSTVLVRRDLGWDSVPAVADRGGATAARTLSTPHEGTHS